jgi:opacity protein-like surface antigen
VLLSAGLALGAQQSESLAATDVLRMLRAGVSEDLVIAVVRKNAKPFQLTAEEIIQLKASGATDILIRVMLDPAAEGAVPAPQPTAAVSAPSVTAPPAPAPPAPPAPAQLTPPPPAPRPAVYRTSRRGAPTNRGSVELIGYGGFNGGLPPVSRDIAQGIILAGGRGVTINEGAKVKWLAGFGVGYAVTRDLLITGEFAYNRLGNPKFTFRPPGVLTTVQIGATLALFEGGGGIQYQIPVPTSRVVPYVAGGVGVVHSRASSDIAEISGFGVSSTVSRSDASGNAGFGIRFYLTERFGLRPEARIVVVPEELFPKKTYFRGSLGIFYQFGG